MSKTHRATRRRQPSLLTASCCATYFPGHADAFQILLYGVYPVLSWSSRLSLYIPFISQLVLAVFFVVHLQNVPEPSQSEMALDCRSSYSATSNSTKLVHWSLMGGLLHLVLQARPRCTKCNCPPINCQYTNHHML